MSGSFVIDRPPGAPCRLGVAGLGTVGLGLIELLRRKPDFAPGGRRAEVVGVCARSRSRPRASDVSAYTWFDDPVALAVHPDVDVFVELIGGADGSAKAAVEAALNAGKPVVTANKALIAEHGLELARLAEAKGVPLVFEAAVMGGVPAVKLVRESLVGDEIASIAGILNGTCNYILSEMEATGRSFAQVLSEAQRLGYAEADPVMDVGGFDAAHKITVLAALAFGGAPNFAAAEIEGIEAIELLDITLAHELGYRIKLIASAARQPGGEPGAAPVASVQVAPALVPLTHPLAQAGGALNALFIEGARTGRIFLQGAGAGAGPTASAVAADLADVMSGVRRPVFQSPAQDLSLLAAADPGARHAKVFLRLVVRDRPGVIANVSEALAKAEVSIDSILQHPVGPTGLVPIVLTTQAASETAISAAVEHIAALDAVAERPKRIRIARI
jgi:homoserine dehydrogenase